jgi:hypothetical protein
VGAFWVQTGVIFPLFPPFSVIKENGISKL